MQSSAPTAFSIDVPAAGPAVRWIRRHPLLALFGIAFGVTWIGVFSQAAALRWGRPLLPPTISGALAVLGCPLAALTVAKATGGVAARNALLLRYVRWRVSIGWYVLALFAPAVLLTAAAGVAELVRSHGLAFEPRQITLASLLSFPGGLLLYARGNWEEMCWRGAALPRLQSDHSALTASLFIGLVWGAWHFPYYFIPDHAVQVMGLAPYVAFTVGGSVILAWIFNSTNGSLLLVTLFHAAFGTWMQLIIRPHDPLPLYIMTFLVDGWAAGLVLLKGMSLGGPEHRQEERDTP